MIGISEILKMGKIYRLCKIILPSGIIFALDAREDESAEWQLLEATADIGYFASLLDRNGYAKDKAHALRILNG